MTTAARKIPEPPPANTLAGHRERLRDRFLHNAKNALADPELRELILFCALPRRDTKAQAKTLLQSFGNLAGVLSAQADDIAAISGLSETRATLRKAIPAAATRMGKTQVMNPPVWSHWEQLIADEVPQVGGVDPTPAYPREIIKFTLNLGASAIIRVHHPPSGDPSPSRTDIQLTDIMSEAAQMMDITRHGHSMTKSAPYSFCTEGLIK